MSFFFSKRKKIQTKAGHATKFIKKPPAPKKHQSDYPKSQFPNFSKEDDFFSLSEIDDDSNILPSIFLQQSENLKILPNSH